MNEKQAKQLLSDMQTVLAILASEGQEDSPLAAFVRAALAKAVKAEGETA